MDKRPSREEEGGGGDPCSRVVALAHPLSPTLLPRTCPPTQVQFLPISALYGHNILNPVPKEMCPWYDGPTLFTVSRSRGLLSLTRVGCCASYARHRALPGLCGMLGGAAAHARACVRAHLEPCCECARAWCVRTFSLAVN